MAVNRDVLTEAEAERVGSVFEAHRVFVESVARQHSPHPQDVPDIVQAVAVQVCRGLNGFRDECEIRGWLYRVTVNTARSHFRRERRVARAVEAVTQLQPPPEPVPDPDQVAIQGERLAALHEAVDRLRPTYRAAVRDLLSGCSVISDRSRRYRAKQELADLLADDPRVNQ